tara:strand:- start:112 stop:348 length:237 start_codon:yes stop_codon:yes gene_type:complete
MMQMQENIKISTQALPHLWNEIKDIAESEGRITSSVVNEAFSLFIENHRNKQLPRKEVMGIYHQSCEDYDELYDLLSK